MAVPLRHELKFFITPLQYEVLSRTLKATLNPDPHGNEKNQYHIRSLYFDTFDDAALYDKVNGSANRSKYRFLRQWLPFHKEQSKTRLVARASGFFGH